MIFEFIYKLAAMDGALTKKKHALNFCKNKYLYDNFHLFQELVDVWLAGLELFELNLLN